MTPVVVPVALLGERRLHEVEVNASLSTPWRTARLKAERLPESVRLRLGYQGGRIDTVFEASVADDLAGDWRGRSDDARLRGLPEWRREIGPKSFQDGRLETVLTWLARECGGKIDLNVKGKPLRHHQVRRGPAHRAVQEALLAWRADAVLLELDGGALHVGPEAETPHAKAGIQARLVGGRNLYGLSDVGGGRYRLDLPGMAWLRVGHRIDLRHDLARGQARITEVTHRWRGSGRTWLEVMLT